MAWDFETDPDYQDELDWVAADAERLLEAGVARVYTPKDFEVSRIMGDIVDLVAERYGVTTAVS